MQEEREAGGRCLVRVCGFAAIVIAATDEMRGDYSCKHKARDGC